MTARTYYALSDDNRHSLVVPLWDTTVEPTDANAIMLMEDDGFREEMWDEKDRVLPGLSALPGGSIGGLDFIGHIDGTGWSLFAE